MALSHGPQKPIPVSNSYLGKVSSTCNMLSADALVLHVEACLLPTSTARYDSTRKHVETFLREFHPTVVLHTCIQPDELADVPFLKEHLESIKICEVRGSGNAVSDVQALSEAILSIHVFQLNAGEGVDHVGEEEDVVASNHWVLPARGLQGVWESLIYDDDIQLQLLDYVYTSMLFGDCEVDTNIISVNRVALLHGPPGMMTRYLLPVWDTTKSMNYRNWKDVTNVVVPIASRDWSDFALLFPKLALPSTGTDRYSFGKLVEINSHSLFSKFFSESGKLVMRMFQQIHQLLDDPDAFIVVLIDEVESLSAARKAALSGMEPSDAIRVVNALLTQLDQLRRRKNVLVMTTSNITEAIDIAFIDRADIKQYIGPPSQRARYAILSSCLAELVAKGLIIQPQSPMIDFREIQIWASGWRKTTFAASAMQESSEPAAPGTESPPPRTRQEESLALWKVAGDCEGFSGRLLRRLPFLAHAFYIDVSVTSLAAYIRALDCAVQGEVASRNKLLVRAEDESMSKKTVTVAQ
ncbi:Pachytene checkpoint protein 2 [Thoreauomyces humboldtii]|nr:Pachytene checkpoint protein 2 [Thoreauomyces humboldtii]